ncbi:hypothetical protein [Acidovorax sp. SUPP3334]|uniref:hypothetical protein n=1 Tax=Acidovorax sp. SUPP3334 TaxID=2920881 RepID=UPI0023DE4FE1|nr:hypothetical protein [Acidovorax sp. SUPP3334]GKT24863.1 hypothetical protein AVHM3334_16105 [Acidovorax sp. SUPP3334]
MTKIDMVTSSKLLMNASSQREATAIGPKINPFNATLRRPAQSLASSPPEQQFRPSADRAAGAGSPY